MKVIPDTRDIGCVCSSWTQTVTTQRSNGRGGVEWCTTRLYRKDSHSQRNTRSKSNKATTISMSIPPIKLVTHKYINRDSHLTRSFPLPYKQADKVVWDISKNVGPTATNTSLKKPKWQTNSEQRQPADTTKSTTALNPTPPTTTTYHNTDSPITPTPAVKPLPIKKSLIPCDPQSSPRATTQQQSLRWDNDTDTNGRSPPILWREKRRSQKPSQPN